MSELDSILNGAKGRGHGCGRCGKEGANAALVAIQLRRLNETGQVSKERGSSRYRSRNVCEPCAVSLWSEMTEWLEGVST